MIWWCYPFSPVPLLVILGSGLSTSFDLVSQSLLRKLSSIFDGSWPSSIKIEKRILIRGKLLTASKLKWAACRLKRFWSPIELFQMFPLPQPFQMFLFTHMHMGNKIKEGTSQDYGHFNFCSIQNFALKYYLYKIYCVHIFPFFVWIDCWDWFLLANITKERHYWQIQYLDPSWPVF